MDNRTNESMTVKNEVGGIEFYVIVTFEESKPVGLFIHIAKEGSTLGGLLNGLAQVVSLGLQHGVTWAEHRKIFKGMMFEPSGYSAEVFGEEYKSLLDAVAHTVDHAIAARMDQLNRNAA